MRAEVYLNQKLVGYSIIEELPFDCDLTEAAKPEDALHRGVDAGAHRSRCQGQGLPFDLYRLFQSKWKLW